MTDTLGNKRVIVDSDALIGLINEDDLLHKRCLKISYYLAQNNFGTITPYPIVLEAATTLAKDKTIRRPDLTHKLLQDYVSLEEKPYETGGVSLIVAELYNPKTSRKNTPFDFYVLALAKKNNVKYVFSFDSFYKQNGLVLVEELIKIT